MSKTFETHNERMVDLRMHEILIVNVINLLCFDDLTFVKQFQCNKLACLFVLGHLNLAETTFAEDTTDLVVLQLQLFYGLALTLLHRIENY